MFCEKKTAAFLPANNEDEMTIVDLFIPFRDCVNIFWPKYTAANVMEAMHVSRQIRLYKQTAL